MGVGFGVGVGAISGGSVGVGVDMAVGVGVTVPESTRLLLKSDALSSSEELLPPLLHSTLFLNFLGK